MIGMIALTGCDRVQVAEKVDDLNDPATIAYLRENARALAEEYGIENPPKVNVIRLIPLSEWGPTQVDCLQAAGFDVESTPDGEGISYRKVSDPALVPALNMAIYTCELQYPVSPRYHKPLAADQLKDLYHYRSTKLVECLERMGVKVQSTPPSEMVFIQSGGAWTPYDDLSLDGGQARTAYKECPQTPDEIYAK